MRPRPQRRLLPQNEAYPLGGTEDAFSAAMSTRNARIEEDVAFVRHASPVAGAIPCRLAARRPRCWRDACRLRDPGLARLCRARWPAAAGRRLRLPVGRARLRAARFVAPAGDRTYLRYLAHDRRHGRGNGARRRAALRTDRQPRSIHRRHAVRARMGVAPERAHEADKQQHSRGLQGRCGAYHCHDPAAGLAGRRRQRAQFFRAHHAARRPAGTDAVPCACGRRYRHRVARARRAVAAGQARRPRYRCIVDHRRIGAEASRAGAGHDRRHPGRLAIPAGPRAAAA